MAIFLFVLILDGMFWMLAVETSTLVLTRDSSNQTGLFMDVLDVPSEEKNGLLLKMCKEYSDGIINSRVYECKSVEFENLPNKIIGYYFDETILTIFKNTKMENRGLVSRKGNDFWFRLNILVCFSKQLIQKIKVISIMVDSLLNFITHIEISFSGMKI